MQDGLEPTRILCRMDSNLRGYCAGRIRTNGDIVQDGFEPTRILCRMDSNLQGYCEGRIKKTVESALVSRYTWSKVEV